MSQMGFVAVPVTRPAMAAALRCTQVVSTPLLKVLAMIRLPLPYVAKFIALGEG